MAALDFPNSPTVGQTFVGGGMTWRWNGTIWALAGNSATTAGQVAYAQITANQTGIGATLVPIGGLSATWTADPTRTYRTTVYGLVSSTVAGDILVVRIMAGASGKQMFAGQLPMTAGYNIVPHFAVVETGLSGSQTRSVSAQRSAGTGTLAWGAASDIPSFILVEDITFQPGGGGGGAGGGSGFTYTQETAPTSPVHGATWHDASTGISYVYVVDVNSSQWVQFAPGTANILAPSFRRFTAGGYACPANTATTLFFADAAGDVLGSDIGNRSAGFFSLKGKGVYNVSVAASWSTTWGPGSGVALRLFSTVNAGSTVYQEYGAQLMGPHPWGYTMNTFTIDQSQVLADTANLEFMMQMWNYLGASITLNSAAVTVSRVSDRK